MADALISSATKSASLPRPPVPSERRTLVRHCCNMASLARLYSERTGEHYFAWIHDVSSAGIAFEALGPFEPGAKLVFQLNDPGDRDDFSVRVQVVHSTADQGMYRVGCQLDEPLPAAWLQAILGRLAAGDPPGSEPPRRVL